MENVPTSEETGEIESCPRVRLSHSAVEDLVSCGEKYRLRRVEHVPRTPSWSMIGGSAVHVTTEIIDLTHLGIINPGVGMLKSPREIFLAELEAKAVQEEILTDSSRSEWSASGRASRSWPNKEDEKWWKANGSDQVESWLNFQANSPWQIWTRPDGEPAIEVSLEWNIGDVRVRGYIDRIMENTLTGALAIVDIKSGSRTPVSDVQLGIYRHGLLAKYGQAPSFGFYFMTRQGGTSVPTDLTQFDDGRLEYMFDAAAKAIEQNIFIPHLSPMCPSCDVRTRCYAYEGHMANQVDRPFMSKGAT